LADHPPDLGFPLLTQFRALRPKQATWDGLWGNAPL
jgi:hypothetical protein